MPPIILILNPWKRRIWREGVVLAAATVACATNPIRVPPTVPPLPNVSLQLMRSPACTDTFPVHVFVVLPSPVPVPVRVQVRAESAPLTRSVYVAFFPEPGAALRSIVMEVKVLAAAEVAEAERRKETKREITRMEWRIAELAETVKARKEMRDVVIIGELVAMAEGTMVREVRMDTGEMIGLRQPTAQERQPGLGVCARFWLIG